MTLGEIAKI